MIHESKDGLAGKRNGKPRTQAAQHMGSTSNGIALYLLFLLPAGADAGVQLRSVGGVLIAFQKYNPSGHLGAAMGRLSKSFTWASCPRRTSSVI